MLLYPESGLAFIHIPKNGGKSIRRALDEALEIDLGPTAADLGLSEGELAAALADKDGLPHPALGQVKIEHLPLVFWKDHFPRSWAAFAGLDAFVLVREPRDRFLSSVLQRLAEFKDRKGLRADDPEVRAEAQRVCGWLGQRGTFSHAEYAHFTRQTDYVVLDGQRRVANIFPIERTDLATAWMRRKAGLAVAVDHDHARREPKAWARSIQPVARFVGRKVLPQSLKRLVYPLWMKSGVFADAASRYATVDLGEEVEAFIAEYYAADAALYQEACSRAQAPAFAGAA